MNASARQPRGLALGPFEMEAVVGSGGMAEVWRGRHAASDMPVAVKVLTAARARTPLFKRAFRREVQAIAGLDHPGIVLVLDHGLVDEVAEACSDRKLVAGSPYLVMELASGGTLRRALQTGDRTWPLVKTILLSLLDSLAHAHARGIIHRDLKPANLLWFGDSSGWKLTDFGVAHALDLTMTMSSRTMRASCGTPQYMAPEQIEGEWRRFGPATDLYGLGCMAFELAAGHRPYQGKNSLDIFDKHLRAPVPRLSMSFQGPSGFEAWVERLLQKRPEDRFQRAADAAWALLALGEPPAEAPAAKVQTPWGVSGPLQTLPLGQAPPEPPSRALTERLPHPIGRKGGDRPPTPKTWHRPKVENLGGRALQGAGLGLFGLRAIPTVGRQIERDRLWAALRAASAESSVRVVLLRGPMGVGTSRLAEWLCQRAHETGAATPLVARYSPTSAQEAGLSEALSRHMRCDGMAREDLIKHTRDWLRSHGVVDAWDLMALVELFSGGERADEGPTSRHKSEAERCGPILRALSMVATRRPAILWCDDAHWGSEALTFARYALETAPKTPLLIVLTVQDEALDELPDAQARLALLAASPHAETMGVAPLADAEMADLIGALLGLAPSLASQVSKRSGGHPLFAIQIIDDWVQRGLLVPGSEGYALADAEAPLPSSLHRIWLGRVGRLLDGRTRHDRVAIEIAAVLGRAVRDSEWRAACSGSMVRPSRDLVEQMVARRLARWIDGGWAFVHGMLRESVLQSARDGGRLLSHHRACAEMIPRLYGARQRAHSERFGRHLLEAGDLARGAEALLVAVSQRAGRGEFEEAEGLLDLRQRALERGGWDTADPRWGRGWVLRARLARMQGRFEEAARWSDRLESEAVRFGWREIRGEGLVEQAHLAAQRGRLERARKLYAQAVSIFEAIGADMGMADGMLGLGGVAFRRGDLRGASACYFQALERFEEVRHDPGIALTLQGMAELALAAEHWSRAEDLFRRSMAHQERLGNRFLWATCLGRMAETRRHAGDLDAAQTDAARAIELLDEMGSVEVCAVRRELAAIQGARGQWSEAAVLLSQVEATLASLGQDAALASAHALHLRCAAEQGDWRAWDLHLGRADALLSASDAANTEDARAIHAAADRALAEGQLDRARAALSLAMTLWSALGRHDRVSDVQRALRTALGF